MHDTTLGELTKEEYERRQSNVDRGSSISYSLAFGAINEILLAGMSLPEYLGSRTVMIIEHMWLGPKYGRFVNRTYNFLGKMSPVGNYFTEVGTGIAFWTLPYFAATILAGAEPEEMKLAVENAVLLQPLIAPTYRVWRDFTRKQFGIAPAPSHANTNVFNDPEVDTA